MKKQTSSQLKKKIDTVFSQTIRLRDCDNSKGELGGECISCGVWYPYEKLQCGHFVSRRHFATRWDEDNACAQCFACNVWKRGNIAYYVRNLEDKIGRKAVDAVIEKSKQTVKHSIKDLEEILEEWSKSLKSMRSIKLGE